MRAPVPDPSTDLLNAIVEVAGSPVWIGPSEHDDIAARLRVRSVPADARAIEAAVRLYDRLTVEAATLAATIGAGPAWAARLREEFPGVADAVLDELRNEIRRCRGR